MALGEPPQPHHIWGTTENQFSTSQYRSTVDNTFTVDVRKVIIPVPMREVPWPPELLKERANVILALDGGAAVQCTECGAYGVLQPDEDYAECRAVAHEVELPLVWGYDVSTSDDFAYGGISTGTNVNWQITTSSTSGNSTLTDLRNLIIK